jgi:hypothetical protein
MLRDKILVAIPCRLAPGAFSGERIFEVRMANGQTYTGVAPRHFCWNARGSLVGEDEPTAEVDGKVAAKVVEEIDDEQTAVEVPDGAVIAVDNGQVQRRPTPIMPPAQAPSKS